MWFTDFYKDLRNLDKIDWKLMNSQFWFDTEDDPDKRRRQAEFLVHQFVPMDLFLGIAVNNEEMKQKVEETMHKCNDNKQVAVRRNWYY